MNRFRRITTVLEHIATALLVLVLAIVIFQVVARFVLRVSAPWSEESARYLLIALVFLGAALSVRKRRHLVVANVLSRGPVVVRVLNLTVIHGVIVGLTAFFAVLAIRMSLIVGTETATSIVWFRTAYLYRIVAVGLACSAVCGVAAFIESLLEVHT